MIEALRTLRNYTVSTCTEFYLHRGQQGAPTPKKHKVFLIDNVNTILYFSFPFFKREGHVSLPRANKIDKYSYVIGLITERNNIILKCKV